MLPVSIRVRPRGRTLLALRLQMPMRIARKVRVCRPSAIRAFLHDQSGGHFPTPGSYDQTVFNPE
jgi:hypothetical protein